MGVCIDLHDFVLVQAFIFACAQRSGWTSVCVGTNSIGAQV